MTRREAILTLAAPAVLAAGGRMEAYDETVHRKVLSAHRGKVVLLDFWATWCSPCRAEMPHLVKLDTKLRSRGFHLITISADEPEQEQDAIAFLKKNRVTPPFYLRKVDNDDKFIGFVDAKWSGALPAMFLYDKAGRKARSFIGETDMKTLEPAITKLL